MAATKVYIMTSIAQQQTQEDRTFLCYEPTTPPWDKKLFYVQDDQGRSWFCHESNIELSKTALSRLAEQIKQEYSPTTKESLNRRTHNPLIIQVALCHVSLERLPDMLSHVKMVRPTNVEKDSEDEE